MYLKSFNISNFRKFGFSDNKVEFKSNQMQQREDEFDIALATTLIVGEARGRFLCSFRELKR